MNGNMLKLNAEKTEVMLFSSKNNLKHVENMTIIVGETSILASNDSIRNLSAHFTPQMDMVGETRQHCL